MDIRIHKSWKKVLSNEFEKPYFTALADFVRSEYMHAAVYPHPKHMFRAFELCPFESVRIVILGQDPYHGHGQANGLCFSVQKGTKHPPSLQNIFKEIRADIGTPSQCETDGDLSPWAAQGVLLLNATLTVRAGEAGSHQQKGWEQFTDSVVKALSDTHEGLVFVLWGRYAQQKGSVIDTTKHYVLQAAHPSPFSAHSGFFAAIILVKQTITLPQKEVCPFNGSACLGDSSTFA